jgi:hypothetical protein
MLLAGTACWFTTATAQDKQEYKFEKNKSYSKSYAISPSDKIVLSNRFGEMKLVTWAKNEVQVDASIVIKSDDEASLQQHLDRINVQDEKSGGTVSFRTEFAKDDRQEKGDKSNWNGSMQINYTVHLPAGSPLQAKNEFGAMIVPDYNGAATLESKFGSLTAGRLTNPQMVKVEFGKATIAEMNGGKLEINFSSGQVDKLAGNVTTKLGHCNAVKLKLDNDVQSLDLNNSYSSVYLDLSRNLSANYQVKTSFGNFINRTSFAIREDERNGGRGMGGSFAGSSGAGAAKINISSSFGDVTAGHDLEVDLTSKKKKNVKL